MSGAGRRVVIIGGAGDMARVAAGQLLAMYDDIRLVIADIRGEKAGKAREKLGAERVETAIVDIFDPDGLKEAIRGCDLVMNATGPYYRTGRPVLEACIEEGVNYIDLCDDEESATDMLGIDVRASEAGITAFICGGLAPGLVNVLVLYLAGEMDEVESVELAWVTGSTPPKEGRQKGGAAVIEHMIHCCTGECVTIRNGRRVKIPSFVKAHEVDFPEPLGTYTVYELGHAETATMPYFMPGIKNVRTMGALHPPFLNGIFRGIAGYVEKGRLTMKEAVDFIVALDAGETPKVIGPYAAVLRGVLSQVLHGEVTAKGFLDFLRAASGREPARSTGGIHVSVEGLAESGRVRRQISYSDYQGEEGGLDMDLFTGTPLAVFTSMLLDGLVTRKGVVAPEGCVDPDEFGKRFDAIMPGHWDRTLEGQR